MQQQKLNVVNTISLKGVSSRYMTSRIYHQDRHKCYIFVGTSQMIYFLSIKKDGAEQYKDSQQEQQVYKLQELKKIDQNEAVFTCLTTMIYKDNVVVLAGFVNKQTLTSQIAAYALNSNLIYFNPNLFNESKINLINIRQSIYAKIQLLFTSSSDNAIRVYRFIEPKQKKYQFELQFMHIFKFDEFIIDFDMNCIFSTEQCVYSHELSNNKVSVDNQDCGQQSFQISNASKQEYLRANSFNQKETEKEEVKKFEPKTMQDFKLAHQSSQEYLQLPSNNGVEIKSYQGLDNQKVSSSSSNLQYTSVHDYNSSQTLEQSSGHNEELNLPVLDKMKKAFTNDGKELTFSVQAVRSTSQKISKSLTVKLPQDSLKHIHFQNDEEIREEGSAESATLKQSQDHSVNEPHYVRNDSGNRSHTVLLSENPRRNNLEINSCQNYSNKSPQKQLQQELRGNVTLSQQSSKIYTKQYEEKSLTDNLNQILKQDEMYISFTDIDGVLIVKKLLVNPNGIDLVQSFQKSVTSFQADLGIAASYCRFIKCADNQLENYTESAQSAQLLSKKQQKKQVKFQQNQKKQQQQLNLLNINQSNATGTDIQQSFDDDEDKLKEQSSSSAQNLQNQDEGTNERIDKVEQLREVNLNLIVTNLMGDVIEFKNVPLQGLDNPVAFPSVDNYNSGVTGLCIKSQDQLEILVSYFDGSVIFFDLNNEDQWNLKLSQPLNSNHFGVYYENTLESDIVFLVSDDTIQIYELNSYHIN